MICLVDITEDNWLDAAHLSVREDQKGFLDSPMGILARGYVYRDCRARVWGISADDRLVGMALVRDMDEEPATYDLQQFMIDQRYQNRGYGTKALELILSRLQAEGKYDCVEVCVHKTDLPALHLYEKAGFRDTGYIDDSAPDCLNLMYHFSQD